MNAMLTGRMIQERAEKGMGLVIPGFIPSPLGDLVEYTPSMVETLVSS